MAEVFFQYFFELRSLLGDSNWKYKEMYIINLISKSVNRQILYPQNCKQLDTLSKKTFHSGAHSLIQAFFLIRLCLV